MIDLDTVIGTSAEAVGVVLDGRPHMDSLTVRVARAALEAAAPLIEAQVREQIAQENIDGIASIEAERHTPEQHGSGCECGFVAWSVEHVGIMTAREVAARIARGGAR